MNIGVISLGCANNQVDTHTMLGYLKAAGHTFTGDPETADVLIEHRDLPKDIRVKGL